MLLLRNQHQQ